MTRAAGMYNTLLQSDEPGIVVEVLNGYRVKERLPSNLSEMTVPLGFPETLRRRSRRLDRDLWSLLPDCLQAAERLCLGRH